jgi:hypothetical protein
MTTMLSGRPGPGEHRRALQRFQEEDDVEMPPARRARRQAQRRLAEEIAAALELLLKAQAAR